MRFLSFFFILCNFFTSSKMMVDNKAEEAFGGKIGEMNTN